MLDTDAEAECTIVDMSVNMFMQLLEDASGPTSFGSDELRYFFGVVSGPASPRNFAEIEVVGNAVVRKGSKPLLFDCIPESKLRRDATVEPMQ